MRRAPVQDGAHGATRPGRAVRLGANAHSSGMTTSIPSQAGHMPDAHDLPRAGVEEGAVGPGSTHTVVEGGTPLRLPHERDESSDSGTGEPSEEMLLAAANAMDGHADAPRGPTTQQRYSDLTEQAQEEGETGAAATGTPGSSASAQLLRIQRQQQQPPLTRAGALDPREASGTSKAA
jgi:hypothetical protein